MENGSGKSNSNCICTENELRLSPEQKTDAKTVTEAVTFIVTGAVTAGTETEQLQQP